MITTTSLVHPTMKRKIMQATANVIRKGYVVDHVINAQGVPIMAIRMRENGMAWVLGRNGRDLTETVKRSLTYTGKA
jgi:aspartate carbamoyltransferase regulatory subunit